MNKEDIDQIYYEYEEEMTEGEKSIQDHYLDIRKENKFRKHQNEEKESNE